MKNADIIDVFKQVGRLNEAQKDGLLSSNEAHQLKGSALLRLKSEREIMNEVFLEFFSTKFKPEELRKKVLEAFIYAGGDINSKVNGTPIWHCAINVQGGYPQLLRLFLEAGANPNATDSEGNTFLHKIILSGLYLSREAMGVLLEAGANVDIKNRSGETAIDLTEKGKKPRRQLIMPRPVVVDATELDGTIFGMMMHKYL